MFLFLYTFVLFWRDLFFPFGRGQGHCSPSLATSSSGKVSSSSSSCVGAREDSDRPRLGHVPRGDGEACQARVGRPQSVPLEPSDKLLSVIDLCRKIFKHKCIWLFTYSSRSWLVVSPYKCRLQVKNPWDKMLRECESALKWNFGKCFYTSKIVHSFS